MKLKNQAILFTFVFLILLTGVFVLNNNHFFSPLFYKKIDSLLKQNHFQGAVLIAKEGKILFRKGYGYANEEHLIPNTPQTIFRIGSITKQFTAAAILKLQEQGKLNIHDFITNYLPTYPQGEKITIHHLLSHTSGIPSITNFSNLQEIQRHPSSPNHVISYFKNLPLTFEPGTECDYSDSGYIVLGAIIEAVTHIPYEEFIQKSFLLPLRMTSTYCDHHYAIIPQRATGYIKDDQGKKFHSNYIDMSFPHAAGALATSVEDLYKWDRALKTQTLLSKESLASLFKIQGASEKHQITYGYGFFIGPQNYELTQADPTIVGHDGEIEGFRAASFRYLDNDLTIILLSNVENTPINDLHLAIAHLIRSYWCSGTTD